MTAVPTPYVAYRRALVTSAPDIYGDVTTTLGPPVPFPVHWGAPGAMQDLTAPNRDATKIAWTICTPSPCDVTEKDVVVWEGKEYAVAGQPRDWTKGPVRNPVAAVTIELERLEG